MKAAKAIVAKRRIEEDKKLADALTKLSVDWSAPVAGEPPAKLTATVSMSPTGPLAPGSIVTVTGTVKNDGAGPAYRVHARAHADDQVFDDAELVFGKIPAGESRSFVTRVEILKDAIARVDRISFDLKEARAPPPTSRRSRRRSPPPARPSRTATTWSTRATATVASSGARSTA